MATQEISIAAFQELLAECADAIDSESWATAKKKYAAAEAVNMALDLSITHANTSTTRRISLEKLNYAIEAAKEECSTEVDDERWGVLRTGFSR